MWIVELNEPGTVPALMSPVELRVPEGMGGIEVDYDFNELVAEAESEKGPWFIAGFDGECDSCGSFVTEGDELRADGEGGWEGKCCV